jgi:glutamate racemase
MTMNIAVFDSGIGGLTVLNEAVRQLPSEHYIYYADTTHVPYGTKSKQDVKGYIFAAVEKLSGLRLKALVVACNTATSIAVDELRAVYPFPIIGMEPAVKPAIEASKRDSMRVLVMATPLTLKESKFQHLVAKVDDRHLVDSLPMPELVSMCERLEFREEVVAPYFKEKLAPFDLSEYGAIVLGCTHYPFYTRLLRTVLPDHISIMDGSSGTVKRLRQVLGERGELLGEGVGSVTFLSSSGTEQDLIKLRHAYSLLA